MGGSGFEVRIVPRAGHAGEASRFVVALALPVLLPRRMGLTRSVVACPCQARVAVRGG
jgi:hypothetical protein